jgi:tRNA 2-selenouridine synthase
MTSRGSANVAQRTTFDEIIDVRSPAEFAADRIPGAINCPALDNEQRAEIGTLYVQVSPFVAKKRGAALVARNIADHLLERFQDRPKNWRPLIYCWRGGQRSGAFVTIFRQIGWDACQLVGGYKAWRQFVVAELETLPARYDFRILCGPTGSGKSRLLAALAAQGAQVLDLEGLAAHRGSVLGAMPEQPQPTQKGFESALYNALQGFDPSRPVYAEAESRKIGALRLPTALLERLRASPCIALETSMAARVQGLVEDYRHFPLQPDELRQRLDSLHGLVSNASLKQWHDDIDAGDWPALVGDLLLQHYDPLYRRSQDLNYPGYRQGPSYAIDDLGPTNLAGVAAAILQG